MRSVNVRIGVWAATALVLVGGCASMVEEVVYPSLGNAKRMSQRQLQAISDQTETLSEQHKLIEPAATASIDELKTAFDEKLTRLQEKTAQERSLVAVVSERAAQLAIKLGAFPEYAEIENRLANVDDAAEEANEDIAALREDTSNLDQRAALVEKDVDILQNTLTQLDRETVAKMAEVSAETVRALDTLKGDGKAFRQKLETELQLTREAMDTLKGLTPEEIMALLAAAVSAAAAGGALGKTGKSRGSAEMEKIKERLDAVTTDIALAKPSSVAEGLVAHGTKTE